MGASERTTAIAILVFVLALLCEPRHILAEPAVTFAELDRACSVPAVHLTDHYSGTRAALEQAGKVVVESSGPSGEWKLSFLTMPGCKLTELVSAPARPMAIFSVTAGGDVLYDGGVHNYQDIYIKRAARPPIRLEAPTDIKRADWQPVLSDDGTALVWTGGTVEQHLQVREIETGKERSIPLKRGPNAYRLIAADVRRDEFMVVAHSHTISVVNSSGVVTWGPTETMLSGTIRMPNVRRLAAGWAAWDFSASRGPERIQWKTTHGAGKREFPPGQLGGVSVDPSGELIAFSTKASRQLNLPGSIALMRTKDATDIFSRPGEAKLAFLGSSYLAISGADGVEVVRVPSFKQPTAASRPTAAPTPAINITDRRIELVERMASAFGLRPERPNPPNAILGRWKLVDIRPPGGCAGGRPFLEFRKDGFAYDLTFRRTYPFRVEEKVIRVGNPLDGEGYLVFQMSGGFYIPSAECGFVKLVRMSDSDSR